MSFKSVTLSMIAALSIATSALAGGPIEIEDAYARSSGAKAISGGAFLTIRNTGTNDDRLGSVQSDAAKKVELHSNIAGENGVMRMVPIEGGISIPAGQEHQLKRGGDHVMLMGLVQPLADGDTISVTLSFEQAGDVTVEIPVDLNR